MQDINYLKEKSLQEEEGEGYPLEEEEEEYLLEGVKWEGVGII